MECLSMIQFTLVQWQQITFSNPPALLDTHLKAEKKRRGKKWELLYQLDINFICVLYVDKAINLTKCITLYYIE